MIHRTAQMSLVGCLLIASAACQGAIGDPGARPGEPGEVPEIMPPPPAEPGDPTGVTGVRRLSRIEIGETVAALFDELGVESSERFEPPVALPDTQHLFSNTIEPGNMSFASVELVMEWAESVSVAATMDVESVLGCAPKAALRCTPGTRSARPNTPSPCSRHPHGDRPRLHNSA